MKNGFTVIELVIVIILLAILSVTALPKFIDMRSEALSARMQAVGGTINSAKNIVYAAALAQGKQDEYFTPSSGIASSTDQPEVRGVSIEYGYPKATVGAIMAATSLKLHRDGKSGDYDFKKITTTFIIFPNGFNENEQCTVTYFQATASEPARVEIDTNGC